MITTEDFADLLGVTQVQAKMVARAQGFGKTNIGKLVVLDEDDVRRYAEDTLVEQIALGEARLASKREAVERFKRYFESDDRDSDRPEDWMSVGEACRVTGKSKSFIHSLARDGVIESRLVYNVMILRRESVVSYVDGLRKPTA